MLVVDELTLFPGLLLRSTVFVSEENSLSEPLHRKGA
jgi:hypothetical protein